MLVFLVLAIAYVVFGVIQPARLEKLMQSTMLKVCRSIEYELKIVLQTDDDNRFNRFSRHLMQLEDIFGISVYNTYGRLHLTTQYMTIHLLTLPSQRKAAAQTPVPPPENLSDLPKKCS